MTEPTAPQPGDRLPALTAALPDPGTLRLSDDLAAQFSVILVYPGRPALDRLTR